MRWENEARLVMHDWGVATVSPGPRRQRGLLPLPKWLYAAIDPEKLIVSIWFAKAEYAEAARAHIPELNRRFSIHVTDQNAAIRELIDLTGFSWTRLIEIISLERNPGRCLENDIAPSR
jgi:hypothetical protein